MAPSMGHAYQDFLTPTALQKFNSRPPHFYGRLPGRQPDNLDVLPAKFGADPGSKRFGDGFFGRKSRCHAFCRSGLGLTVGEFPFAQDTV